MLENIAKTDNYVKVNNFIFKEGIELIKKILTPVGELSTISNRFTINTQKFVTTKYNIDYNEDIYKTYQYTSSKKNFWQIHKGSNLRCNVVYNNNNESENISLNNENIIKFFNNLLISGNLIKIEYYIKYIEGNERYEIKIFTISKNNDLYNIEIDNEYFDIVQKVNVEKLVFNLEPAPKTRKNGNKNKQKKRTFLSRFFGRKRSVNSNGRGNGRGSNA